MKRDVILKVTTCVLICIALWLLLSIAVRSIILEAAVGLVDKENGDSEGGDLDLTVRAGHSELVFGGLPDPLMTYNVDEQHWTLSDRFLEDVADALVPVLKERGFVQISYGPPMDLVGSAYGVQADIQALRATP